MGLTATLDAPFFTGKSTSAVVPGLYPVAVAGHPYLVEENGRNSDRFRRRSIEFLRPQADQRDSPGQHSINPDDLWRRTKESWHRGAGQDHLDREDSDPYRFRSSKGIDPWTRWQITSLPDTDQKRASTNTNLLLAVAGDVTPTLFVVDGTQVRETTDVTVDSPAWSNVSYFPSTPPNAVAITSDGWHIYTANGTGGIWRLVAGGSVPPIQLQQYNARPVNGILAYVKGRLIASNDNVLVNITGTASETIVLTHPNIGFRWVGAAVGPAFIYAAGYSGDKSLIYKTAVKADGTALETAVVAGELPDGEVVRSIHGYLGFMCIGTDKGMRFASVDEGGNLTIGALVETNSAVLCFEPQGRFVWFGWTNFDSTSTGLGRLDLTAFTDSLTPAYASDLMAGVQGPVTSVVTFQDRRVFTVSGSGVWAEDTVRVPVATLDSGVVTYGLADPKTALFLDLRHQEGDGTARAYLAVDGAAFALVGTHDTSGSSLAATFPTGQLRGETFEVRLELLRDAATTSEAPVLTRTVLRADPTPRRSESFFVPLILHETIEVDGREVRVDIDAEMDFLLGLENDGAVTTYQEGVRSHSVRIRNHEWIPASRTANGTRWNGVLVLELRSVV